MATDLTSSREAVRELSGLHAAADFKAYRARVLTDGDIDDHRKLAEIHFRNLGMDADKKVDPLAGKTIVTVNYINGGVRLTAEQAPVVQDVQAREVPAASPALPHVVITTPVVDVDQLVGELDTMLGVVDD